MALSSPQREAMYQASKRDIAAMAAVGENSQEKWKMLNPVEPLDILAKTPATSSGGTPGGNTGQPIVVQTHVRRGSAIAIPQPKATVEFEATVSPIKTAENEVGKPQDLDLRVQAAKKYMAKPSRRHSMETGDMRASNPDLIDKLRNYYQHEDDDSDDEWTTDKALLQRESLRFDPQILGLLNTIWVTARHHHKMVQKDDYIEMSMKLYRFLVADGDDEGAMKMATEEWERDSHGHDHLERTRFAQSWFELTDKWTDTIDAEHYCEFLQGIIEQLTVVVEDGTREWKKDADIQPHVASPVNQSKQRKRALVPNYLTSTKSQYRKVAGEIELDAQQEQFKRDRELRQVSKDILEADRDRCEVRDAIRKRPLWAPKIKTGMTAAIAAAKFKKSLGEKGDIDEGRAADGGGAAEGEEEGAYSQASNTADDSSQGADGQASTTAENSSLTDGTHVPKGVVDVTSFLWGKFNKDGSRHPDTPMELMVTRVLTGYRNANVSGEGRTAASGAAGAVASSPANNHLRPLSGGPSDGRLDLLVEGRPQTTGATFPGVTGKSVNANHNDGSNDQTSDEQSDTSGHVAIYDVLVLPSFSMVCGLKKIVPSRSLKTVRSNATELVNALMRWSQKPDNSDRPVLTDKEYKDLVLWFKAIHGEANGDARKFNKIVELSLKNSPIFNQLIDHMDSPVQTGGVETGKGMDGQQQQNMVSHMRRGGALSSLYSVAPANTKGTRPGHKTSSSQRGSGLSTAEPASTVTPQMQLDYRPRSATPMVFSIEGATERAANEIPVREDTAEYGRVSNSASRGQTHMIPEYSTDRIPSATHPTLRKAPSTAPALIDQGVGGQHYQRGDAIRSNSMGLHIGRQQMPRTESAGTMSNMEQKPSSLSQSESSPNILVTGGNAYDGRRIHRSPAHPTAQSSSAPASYRKLPTQNTTRLPIVEQKRKPARKFSRPPSRNADCNIEILTTTRKGFVNFSKTRAVARYNNDRDAKKRTPPPHQIGNDLRPRSASADTTKNKWRGKNLQHKQHTKAGEAKGGIIDARLHWSHSSAQCLTGSRRPRTASWENYTT
jgi:hypothetical protein